MKSCAILVLFYGGFILRLHRVRASTFTVIEKF